MSHRRIILSDVLMLHLHVRSGRKADDISALRTPHPAAKEGMVSPDAHDPITLLLFTGEFHVHWSVRRCATTLRVSSILFLLWFAWGFSGIVFVQAIRHWCVLQRRPSRIFSVASHRRIIPPISPAHLSTCSSTLPLENLRHVRQSVCRACAGHCEKRAGSH